MTRTSKPPAVRRLTKEDGRASRYATLKSSPGIVIPEVKQVLLARQRAEPAFSRRGMYPSEMASSDWCPRATFYRMSGKPEPPRNNSFQLENVFAHGNQVHSKWQDWLADTGKLWGDWKCYRCGSYFKNSGKPDTTGCVGASWVTMNGATLEEGTVYPHDWKYKEVTLRSATLPISGHADGALTGHDTLIEFKSLGIGSIRYSAPTMLENHTYTVNGKTITDVDGIWKNFHSPLPSHVRQGQLYLWMCQEMALPFNKMSFIYEFKPNNQVKEFIIPFNESLISSMLDTARLVVESLSSNTPPPCPKGGCGECRKYEK